MERAGIPVPGLQARDGLGTINGANVLTAMSALLLYDVDYLLRQAEIACAMSLEALLANLKPYDKRLHELRGFPGAVRSARPRFAGCIEGSDLATGKIKTKVQDAYSMRSSPQVIGAAHDAVVMGGPPGRDRVERSRRQPDLHPGRAGSLSPAQTFKARRYRCPWRWSARRSPW